MKLVFLVGVLRFVGVFSASELPCDFIWGTATAAYQVEGAWNVDGRGESIWDIFSKIPGNVFNGDTGDDACLQYFKFREDVAYMRALGVRSYRFSISWPRVLPDGTGAVNELGISYYNQLINELLGAGITPFVTLYHWDLPQALYERYTGWLDPQIQDDFTEYARLCFARFGDRVKNWITFNEPKVFSVVGHGYGTHAPGRCSDRNNCAEGNSTTEPYIVSHNALIAHAKAVNVYRTEFGYQNGEIGITLDGDYSFPWTNSPGDIQAAETRQQFHHGWYFDPVFFGDYPEVMKTQVGDRLPRFTPEESELLRGSSDFAGINHYSSRWVGMGEPCDPCNSVDDDEWTRVTTVREDGVPIGDQAASEWLWVVPTGIRGVINWVANRYGNPPIYITENGRDEIIGPNDPIEVTLNDVDRIVFYDGYITNVLLALQDGSNVQGYFAWSLLDNFEWAEGYKNRFGLTYVNFTDPNRGRIPRRSAEWYSELIKNHMVKCRKNKKVNK